MSRYPTHLPRSRALLSSAVLALCFPFAACNGSSDDDGTPVATQAAVSTPATPVDRLAAAYPDPGVDPSRAAWEALLADDAFATQPVAIAEFVRLKDGSGARADYDAFVDALSAALTAAGGTMLSVNDILRPGLEGMEGYEGGVSWIAEAPSASAYVDAMLADTVVAASPQRSAAVAEAYTLIGPNLLPDIIKQLPPDGPASDYPSQRVEGKTPDEFVGELLAIYPSGGADPTEETLRWMHGYEGFAGQRVHYINLYRFKGDGGEAALSEYNAEALPAVLAHGARPKVLANVTHQLAGPIAWDRFIFVSWPSLAVFSDLRLDPTYVEAQKSRVVSAEQYGNLITLSRADQQDAE